MENALHQFHSVSVKGNCAHLVGKNSRPGPKITTICRLSRKYLNRIIKKF